MARTAMWIGLCSAAMLATGCGSAETPAGLAAAACEAQAKSRLGGKPYTLDLAMLASSATDDGRGGLLLSAPIVVNAGLADEGTQQLECTVRLSGEPPSAEVLNLRFIW